MQTNRPSFTSMVTNETGGPERWSLWLVGGLLVARLVSLLAMPLAGLRGYGDFIHFYTMASLPGWPFFDYWVEFPPVFSFLSALLYRVAGGQQHVYDYLLFFTLTLADGGNLYLFIRLNQRLHPSGNGVWRVLIYFIILLSLAYCWWYFDPLAVFFMLLGLWLLLEGRLAGTGFALSAGILTKLFPGLALLAAWQRFSWRQLALLALVTLLPVVLVWGSLELVSPDFTLASLRSQASKGSWGTVWALLDGNYQTGNFGPEIERLDPALSARPMGNPPRISPWLRLLPFVLLGLLAIWRLKPQTDHQSLALFGFGWCLFMLWSPGWSPQWILYILPVLLLVLPDRMAVLFALMLVMVNLLEWPILLSRGFFWSLPLTVLLRSLLLILLGLGFYQTAAGKEQGG